MTDSCLIAASSFRTWHSLAQCTGNRQLEGHEFLDLGARCPCGLARSVLSVLHFFQAAVGVRSWFNIDGYEPGTPSGPSECEKTQILNPRLALDPRYAFILMALYFLQVASGDENPDRRMQC